MLKKDQLGIYEKSMPGFLSLEEKLKLAGEAGYDFLEISIDETEEKLQRLEYGEAERRDIRAAMERTGIPIRTMCLSGQRKYPMGSKDPKTEKRSMDIMEKAIGFAADTGIRIIQLAGYDVYYEPSDEETANRFQENLQKAVSMAASCGVILALETMENAFMNTCEKAMRYIRQVSSPYLKLYPDVGNLTNALGDPRADLTAAAEHIVSAHLKETLPQIFREVPFGMGHTDFAAVIKTLNERNVHMFLLEFWYDGETDPLSYIKNARDFMKKQFEKAGVKI